MLPNLFLVAAPLAGGETPTISLARLPDGVARPVVDGVLDDDAWAHASVITDLIQVEPNNGAPISERTEVLLLHDERGVFVAFRCFDSNPAGILGTQMQRDVNLDPDDRVEIYFDTFLDRRNAYWFQIGPVGGKGDALITKNGSGFNKDFDTIWHGESRITADGWFAEMEIPAASMNFDPAGGAWGFNIRRHVRRKNEVGRWAASERRFSFFSIAQGGTLTGVGPMAQGIGLELTPFAVADWGTDREAEETDLETDAGLDAIYRITPDVKLTLSLNTDFAETEVDERVVNLTRFPVFFPEKRDFFLEDSGNFLFGDGGTPIPFFSRRIGLDDDGLEVPIDAAAKLTGSTDDYTWGLLDVQTGEGESVDEQNLFVGRFSKNLGEQSDVGVIMTAGDPEDAGRDATYGVDLNMRTDSFLGDKNLRVSTYALATPSAGEDDDHLSYHAGLEYPNDTVQLEASYTVIEDDFDPALGFVRRTGVKEYELELEYRWREVGPFRWVGYKVSPELITDTANNTETVETVVRPLDLLWESGEELRLDFIHSREVLDEDFEISDGVFVPEGAHTFLRYGVSFESSSRYPISGEAKAFTGEFYGGDRNDYEIELDWRYSRHATFGLEHEVNDIDLPDGAFIVRSTRARANFHLSPSVSWTNFVQYDNVSDDLGLNSRMRWILSPGRDLNFVINQSWLWDESTFQSLTSELTAKLSLSFRF